MSILSVSPPVLFNKKCTFFLYSSFKYSSVHLLPWLSLKDKKKRAKREERRDPYWVVRNQAWVQCTFLDLTITSNMSPKSISTFFLENSCTLKMVVLWNWKFFEVGVQNHLNCLESKLLQQMCRVCSHRTVLISVVHKHFL